MKNKTIPDVDIVALPRKHRKRPQIKFRGPSDTPNGVSFESTGTGYKINLPDFSILPALLFAFLASLSVYILYYGFHADKRDHVPGIFFVIMFLALGFFIQRTMRYLLGMNIVEIRKDKMVIRKGILGIGIPRFLELDDIERVRAVKRTGGTMAGFGFGTMIASVPNDEHVIEVETDERVVRLGSYLNHRQLMYLRYVLVLFMKERVKVKKKMIRFHPEPVSSNEELTEEETRLLKNLWGD